MSVYTQVFGGTTIYPSNVSYLALALTADVTLSWPLDANTSADVAARILGPEFDLGDLAEADLLMAVNGWPTLAAVREAGAARQAAR